MVGLDDNLVRPLLDLVGEDAAALEDGRIIHANASMSRWLLQELDWEAVEGHYLWEIVPEGLVGTVKDWYESLKERGDRYGILDLMGPTVGTSTPWGRLYLIRIETRDVIILQRPERVPLMLQLRAAENRNQMFDNFFSNAFLGLVVLRPDDGREGVIHEVSYHATHILQREESDLLGMEFAELVDKKDVLMFKNLFAESRRRMGMTFQRAFSIRGEDGDRIILDAWMGPYLDGNEHGTYLIFRDITARIMLMDELRHFAWAFDTMNDTVLILGRDCSIIYINPMGLERMGYELHEVLGRSLDVLISPSETESSVPGFTEMVERDGHWIGEKRVRTKDGRSLPVELSASVGLDPRGRPEQYVVVMRDLSNLKAIQEREVMAREKAEFFLELVSHDLMDYLLALVGNLDIAVSSLDGVPVPEELERARGITDRMARLVTQVSMLSQTKVECPLQPMDLADVIEGAIRDVEARYHEVRFNVEVEGLDGTILVNADNLITSLFTNLMENAIVHDGLVETTIEIRVEDRSGTEGDLVEVSVADHGPGIPDEYKSIVFYDYFQRVEGSSSKGLGLHLVKALTSRYDGKVWIEDRVPGEPQGGTRVVMLLPGASEHGATEGLSDHLMDAPME